MKNKFSVQKKSMLEYRKSDELQKRLQKQRIADAIEDTLLLLEHPNVITLGTRGKANDIHMSTAALKAHSIEVESTDRGGQVTLHSPGQLIGYFIFKLSNKTGALRLFLHNVEQSLVNTLARLGIKAEKSSSRVGIWVENRKIASIGISVNHRVTRHGFALNVNNNLALFKGIVPCGLSNITITSIEKELGGKQSIEKISSLYAQELKTLYN